MSVYANEVTAAHVGRRVTVRHVILEDGRERPTDVVGHLVAADDATWTVRRRSGELVEVPVDRVVASRLLPDAPPPRRRH